MEWIMNLIAPHLVEITSFIAGAAATGLAWLVRQTSTKVDDQLVEKIAEETSKKLKEEN